MAESEIKFLETERMYFRQFRADDAQFLFELDSDPEVMRFISKGQPTPLVRIQNEFIPRFLDYYRQSPPRGFWAVHLLATSEFIGWFHLRPDKIAPEEMELGYRLRRNVWGHGLATEGSRALIEKAFDEWGYAKVILAHMGHGKFSPAWLVSHSGQTSRCNHKAQRGQLSALARARPGARHHAQRRTKRSSTTPNPSWPNSARTWSAWMRISARRC